MEKRDDLSVVEEALARLAVLEDVGTGDLTAAIVPEGLRARATVIAKQEAVISGLGVARQVFLVVDRSITVETSIASGGRITPGQRVLQAVGPARGLLTAERPVLNFLQHLSGVATLTARFVEAARRAGGGARITDTRKTVPGLRLLEKEAVLDGGGVNHRVGLYDAVMIKENHIAAAGGITAAVTEARRLAPRVPIIVEARTLVEAEEAARLGVGRVLLDNMSPEQITRAVGAIRAIEEGLPPPEEGADTGRWLPGTWRPGDRLIQIEVSGSIAFENLTAHLIPGVDFLSVGQLTHSAPAIDLSIDLEPLV